MLQILRKGAKDVGGRRVIEAVDALARERREIAQDLTAALATYLNTHISLQRLKRDRSGSAPLRADHGQALG
jgi:hypothetical protein